MHSSVDMPPTARSWLQVSSHSRLAQTLLTPCILQLCPPMDLPPWSCQLQYPPGPAAQTLLAAQALPLCSSVDMPPPSWPRQEFSWVTAGPLLQWSTTDLAGTKHPPVDLRESGTWGGEETEKKRQQYSEAQGTPSKQPKVPRFIFHTLIYLLQRYRSIMIYSRGVVRHIPSRTQD